MYTLKIKYGSAFQLAPFNEEKQVSHLGKEINCFPVLISIFDLVVKDPTFYMNFKGFKPNKFNTLKKNCSQFLSYLTDKKETALTNYLSKQLDELNKPLLEDFNPDKLFSSIIDVNSKFDNVCTVVEKADNEEFVYNVIEV